MKFEVGGSAHIRGVTRGGRGVVQADQKRRWGGQGGLGGVRGGWHYYSLQPKDHAQSRQVLTGGGGGCKRKKKGGGGVRGGWDKIYTQPKT